MTRVALLGGGGHAAVVAEAARAAGWEVIGYLSDDTGEDEQAQASGAGLVRLGAIADMHALCHRHAGCVIHAAVGDADVRAKWLDECGDLAAPAIVHPSAIVSPSAHVAGGAFIGPRVVVNARAVIGRGVIVNTAAVVEHDCAVDAFSHIAPGSVLCGGVQIGQRTLIGAGATIIPRMKVGSRCTVGAGSVVIAPVADGTTVVGSPARIVGKK